MDGCVLAPILRAPIYMFYPTISPDKKQCSVAEVVCIQFCVLTVGSDRSQLFPLSPTPRLTNVKLGR